MPEVMGGPQKRPRTSAVRKWSVFRAEKSGLDPSDFCRSEAESPCEVSGVAREPTLDSVRHARVQERSYCDGGFTSRRR